MNFMCHKRLEVELNANVNFIHGRNGSEYIIPYSTTTLKQPEGLIQLIMLRFKCLIKCLIVQSVLSLSETC